MTLISVTGDECDGGPARAFTTQVGQQLGEGVADSTGVIWLDWQARRIDRDLTLVAFDF